MTLQQRLIVPHQPVLLPCSVEIQNAERKVLYKKDFYDVAIARVDAERQLDFPQLGKGTYIIKITDDKVHFLKLVI